MPGVDVGKTVPRTMYKPVANGSADNMDTDESSEGEEIGPSLLRRPPGGKEMETEVPPNRVLITVCLNLLCISYGLIMSVFMTTMVDFTELLHENYSHLGMALAVQFLTSFCGLYLGGFLQDGLKWRHELLLAYFAFGISLVNILLPHSVNLIMFASLVGVEGLVQGIIGPAANNLLILLWKEKSPTPINVFHLGWGIGSLIGPLLSKPFLSERCPSASENNTEIVDPVCQQSPGDNEIKYIRESRIAIPFTLAAVPMFIMGVVFLAFYFRDRHRRMIAHCTPDVTDPSLKIRVEQPKLWRVIIVALLVCYYFTITIGYLGQYLFTIAFESDLKLSKGEASRLSAAFNGAHTVGRVLSSIILQWISIKIVFMFYVIGTLASVAALAFFGLESSTSLWLLSCIYGVYSGPVWPCAIAWANHYIHLYTINLSTAISGAPLGEMLLFWLGGHLIDSGQIPSIFIMTLCATAFTFIVVLALYVIGYHIGERKFRERDLAMEMETFK